MKKIGVIGGTFDPIHIGHLYIAYEAYHKLGLDEVIFMPNGNPPHKQEKNITDEKIRYAMVEEAIKNYSFFTVSNYEIEKKGLSFTYETLEYLKNKLGKVELYFITGADCLIEINTWKNVNMILNFSNFVVFSRPGFDKIQLAEQKRDVERKYNTNITFLDLLQLDISSSLIRERVKNDLEVGFFLSSGVLKIVKKHKLYK